MLIQLSFNDLKKRYAGSIGGIIWAYVLPLVTILVFWFVFQVGFRNPPVEGTQFILWFTPAYVAWTFANDAILQSSNVIYEYSFLVKKVKFNIYYLPIIKIIASLFVHLFFILFVFILNFIYQTPFDPMWFQVFYYTFALSIFLVGVSFFTSSITVFWKDFAHIINVILQVLFWATPIFWNPDTMKEEVLNVLQFNPMYYIVTGYRNCFVPINGAYEPFFIHWKMMLYFWIFTLVTLVLGVLLFKRLSKHYSDLI